MKKKDEKRTVLVTGAAGGLGSALCTRLAADGYRVIACDISPEAVPSGEGITPMRLDVTDQASVDACAAEVARMTGRLYAVINLAGVFRMSSVSEAPVEGLERALAVNLVGMYRVNRALLPLLEPKYSRIINMSSEIGRYSPQPFNGDYAISKHAVDTYCDVLRRELMFVGIPVCKIQAGSFSTQMLGAARAEYDRMLAQTTRFKRELTVLAPIMTSELEKGYPPEVFARAVEKQLRRRKPRACVRLRNSFKLSLLDILPEVMQDAAYRVALALFGIGRKV